VGLELNARVGQVPEIVGSNDGRAVLLRLVKDLVQIFVRAVLEQMQTDLLTIEGDQDCCCDVGGFLEGQGAAGLLLRRARRPVADREEARTGDDCLIVALQHLSRNRVTHMLEYFDHVGVIEVAVELLDQPFTGVADTHRCYWIAVEKEVHYTFGVQRVL